MKVGTIVLASLGMIGVVATGVGAADVQYTYADLVNQIIDLQALASPPQPGETCRLFSSYDRKSRFDETTGRYLNWDANADGDGIIRMEGDVTVLAEMNGPGVIRRIWSADPQDGHVRIYLDGATEPAVDLPFKSYFNRSANEPAQTPFTRGNLSYVTNGNGFNNYIPIPFQKSCKIVADKGWGRFYQFTYTTYPAGTVVPTFTRDLPPADLAALDRVDAILRGKLGHDPADPRLGQKIETKTVTAKPGQRTLVAELAGQRAITALRVKLSPMPAKDDIETLRELCLRITWDDETTPAVWAPLGDFFGSAPGLNPFRSLPLGMDAEGFYCLWYMPFATNARIELVNDGTAARQAELQITHAPWTGAPDSALRFHTKWHRDTPPHPEPERAIDWPLLQVKGSGRLVGVMLAIWNLYGDWWGEGDEKFSVDGEHFPSSCGTGSEDYFGYAWSSGKLFQQAFHGQTRDTPRLAGHLSVHRWHVADNVPFHTRLEADIEKYFSNLHSQYAATVSWYQTAGEDPYPEQPLGERTGYYAQPFQLPGAVSATDKLVTAVTGGKYDTPGVDRLESSHVTNAKPPFRAVEAAELATRRWNLGHHLRWYGAKLGDKLTLAMPVAAAGSYRLSVRMTKAWWYGIVQCSVDGTKIGDPIDTYSTEFEPTKLIPLGTVSLTAGTHQLGFEITGCNDKIHKGGSYEIGIDCYTLEAVP